MLVEPVVLGHQFLNLREFHQESDEPRQVIRVCPWPSDLWPSLECVTQTKRIKLGIQGSTASYNLQQIQEDTLEQSIRCNILGLDQVGA